MAVETKMLNCVLQLEKSLGKKLTSKQIEIIAEYGTGVIKESYDSMRRSFAETFKEK